MQDRHKPTLYQNIVAGTVITGFFLAVYLGIEFAAYYQTRQRRMASFSRLD